MWNNLPVILAAHHDWFLLACAAGTVLLLDAQGKSVVGDTGGQWGLRRTESGGFHSGADFCEADLQP